MPRDLAAFYVEELAELRATVRSMRLVLAHMPGILVGLYTVDGRCVLLEGVKPAEVTASEGRHYTEFLPEDRRERFEWLFARAAAGTESRADYPISDGVLLEAVVRPIFDVRGAVGYVLFYCRDVTVERAARGARDTLTGLAKKALFRAQAAMLVRRGAPFAVLFIDLDGFKAVNDSRGHRAGDVVLERVSRALQAATRAGDLSARVGGDEFAVLLSTPGADPMATARRILDSVLAAARADGAGASMGVALYPEHGASVEELLAAADDAMYASKQAGGGAAVLAAPSSSA